MICFNVFFEVVKIIDLEIKYTGLGKSIIIELLVFRVFSICFLLKVDFFFFRIDFKFFKYVS